MCQNCALILSFLSEPGVFYVNNTTQCSTTEHNFSAMLCICPGNKKQTTTTKKEKQRKQNSHLHNNDGAIF